MNTECNTYTVNRICRSSSKKTVTVAALLAQNKQIC